MKKIFLLFIFLITAIGYGQEPAPTIAKGGIQTPNLSSYNRLESSVYASIRWDNATQSFYYWNPLNSTWNVFGGGDSYEGYSETGTRLGGDLYVELGDHDSSGNGTRIEISDSDEEIYFFTGSTSSVFSESSTTFWSTTFLGITSPRINLNGAVEIKANSSYEITLPTPTLDFDRTQNWSDGNGLIEVYAGTYNAATDTPTLDNTVLREGEYYIVSVAGSIDFGDGAVTLGVGDIVGCNDTEWFKKVNNNQGGGGTDDQTASEVVSDDSSYDVLGSGLTVQADLVTADNLLYSSLPRETTDTGTEIFLSTSGGIVSNFGSANTNTAYTEGSGSVLNGWNQILINPASEPTYPVSWTQQGGIEWEAGVLYLIVRNTGSQGVIYYYLPTAIQSETSSILEYGITGTIDNTNRVFTVSNNYQTGTIKVWLNGLLQFFPDNITETGSNEITFAIGNEPQISDKITVEYISQ